MTMIATVIRPDPRGLLVTNEDNGEEVLVITRQTEPFSAGDRIRVTHNGQMTFSLPPQLAALSVELARPNPPAAAEMRAVVLERGDQFLIVRNERRQRIRVDTPFAHHFCVRQRIVVKHDVMIMGDPPRVNALDITPLC